MRLPELADTESALQPESHSNSQILTAALAASALLTACGGGGSGGGGATPVGSGPTALPTTPAGPSFPSAVSDEDAARFLLQAQFFGV